MARFDKMTKKQENLPNNLERQVHKILDWKTHHQGKEELKDIVKDSGRFANTWLLIMAFKT